ncbi:MAG TPA: LLM class flavin-dependent oxidoreductase [Candidatus Limnocylindrales bacterium]|nr:LLM class flavin-dependent oxidoreductase [Candidatus Limnocylindrales bacterium]
MRVGFATGYDRSLTVRDMASAAGSAESAGFEMAFFSETIELIRDSVTTLAALSLGTNRIRLGATQTARIRNPLVMAQTIATLSELSGGRIVVAVGACTATHAKRFGLEPADPTRALEDWVNAIRLLLTGREVSYEGSTFSFPTTRLPAVNPDLRAPIWIPATSRTGLELAGRIGDGVLLNAAASPAYTRNALRIVRDALAANGRDPDTFDVAQIVNCSIGATEREALDAVRWEIASKFSPRQFPVGMPARLRVGEPVIDPADIPGFANAYEEGGTDGLARAFPDAYVAGLTASGTTDQVRSRVDEYVAAGVTLPILRPASREQIPHLISLFAA